MLTIISATVKTRRALGEYKTLHPMSKKKKKNANMLFSFLQDEL